MPRGRAPLTEKQERILVQAQLMGLTPKDMQQIGNRLIALQKEAQDKADIAETTLGYTWEVIIDNTRKDEKAGWRIRTPDGYQIDAYRGKKGRSSWDNYSWDFDITINKPGTRYKTRHFKEKSLYIPYDWKKSLMPAGNKELYALIKWSKNIQWELA